MEGIKSYTSTPSDISTDSLDNVGNDESPLPGTITSASDPDVIYRGTMRLVESMYGGVQFIRQRKMNAQQRKSIAQLFTGAIQLVSNTQNWVRKMINARTTAYARQQLESEVDIEGQVFKYLEDNNCVYVLGCEELESERQLYDERSWTEYILQCEGLNLWKASQDPNVVQMVNDSFRLHYSRMGRADERLPSRIGILLFLMELSFTGTPSYELEPSSAPFYSIVERLYGNVVAERIEMVNEYLAGNLTVIFDGRGNVASITRFTVAPNEKKSISYGLNGTIQQILKDFPVHGDFDTQMREHMLANNMSAVDILTNPTMANWSQGRQLAVKRDQEVQAQILKEKKLRKMDGGRRTHKRNKRHGKSHKKHRKSNKKSSRRRGRK